MEYKGKLYGKVGGVFYKLKHTTDDWERMENRIAELEALSVKNMDWINVKDKLPEDFGYLIIKPTDELSPTKTKRILVLTDTGSIIDNRRLKMQVGKNEWEWLMKYEGENIIKWTVFKEPTE